MAKPRVRMGRCYKGACIQGGARLGATFAIDHTVPVPKRYMYMSMALPTILGTILGDKHHFF